MSDERDNLIIEYSDAFRAANRRDFYGRIKFEGGWFVVRSLHSSMILWRKREADLRSMVAVLRERVAEAAKPQVPAREEGSR